MLVRKRNEQNKPQANLWKKNTILIFANKTYYLILIAII